MASFATPAHEDFHRLPFKLASMLSPMDHDRPSSAEMLRISACRKEKYALCHDGLTGECRCQVVWRMTLLQWRLHIDMIFKGTYKSLNWPVAFLGGWPSLSACRVPGSKKRKWTGWLVTVSERAFPNPYLSLVLKVFEAATGVRWRNACGL